MMSDHHEQLMEYLYQELSPEEARRFEDHLGTCEMCQKDLADFRRLRQALAAWDVEEVPHISLTIDGSPSRGWLALWRAFPIWMRLVTAAAAAMLVLALFNVQMSYHPQKGFQFSASLWPRAELPGAPQPKPRPVGLTEEQVTALIRTAITQTQRETNEQMAAQLQALAAKLRSENERLLIQMANTLRQEQEERLAELEDQLGQPSTVSTLAELFWEEPNSGY